MKKFEGKSQRRRERLSLSLPVRVKCLEATGEEWMETTRLLDVTPFGARFALPRVVERGRLLHLTLPMPRQLRCFDHLEDQYRVWALVRNVSILSSADADSTRFAIGVAFTGKHPPKSHLSNPGQLYDVTLHAQDSLYILHEAAPPTTGSALGRSDATRLSLAVEVNIQVLDEHGRAIARESTVTENISRRGAAVFTGLNLERGRFVIVQSAQHQLSVLAVVRACRKGPDGIMRLHLEFMGQQWPLEGIA